MRIKGRPIGIWLICLSLVFGIMKQLYFWLSGEQFTIESILVICLSLVFCAGLYSFNKWVCIVFVLLCGIGALIATTAAIIILGTNSVGLSNDWSALISGYWPDAVAVLIAYGCAYYLTRRDVRDLFIANKSNQSESLIFK